MMNNISETEKRRVIVGMGLTGLSCARYFSSLDIDFVLADSRTCPPLKETFDMEFPKVEKYCGEFTQDVFCADDYLVISPGVDLNEPFIAKALKQGAMLTSDVELFLEVVDSPVVAITGSNGKSTVTMLVAAMLENADKKVCVAGNIGLPVLDQLVSKSTYDIYVLELSSFQLERLESLSAKIVTILNVTEDHMDRYRDLYEYLEAKQKIFIGAENIVVNRDDKLTDVNISADFNRIDYGLSAPGEKGFGLLEVDGQEWIAYEDNKIILVDQLKIKGRHNISNAMAALALGKLAGLDWKPMIKALRDFKGLRHRCEWVAEYKGVNYYNDSKATNVGAAVAAINGFTGKYASGNLILIAGGLDKDSDFSPMAEAVRKNVEKVFLIGKDAKKIELAIGSEFCCFSKDLPTAVNDANKLAKTGDVVLFAPACASFDMFKNYEERGDAFVSAVKALAG